MVSIPSVWNLGEGWVRWFTQEDVIETTWWRVVAILGASVALWYAFAPVPRTFQVLWLIMRPYWVTSLGYWNLRDRVERVMGMSGECDVVIASDLHTESGRGTLEGGLNCGVIFPWLRWMLATSRAKGLLLLGDITDTGDRNAWHRATDLFREADVERAAVPGNHDIHFKRIADHSPDLTWLGNWRSVLRTLGASENSFDATTVRAPIDAVEGRPGRRSFPRLHGYGHLPVGVLLFDSNTRPSG
jgi:hypothetical protein